MTPFSPQGPSVIVAYADDSTDQAITLTTGEYGVPNCLYVVNPDGANVVAVNYSFDSLNTNASVPDSGANGIGTVVGPFGSVLIRIDSNYRTGNLYLSAAGVSGTGNVYITPGAI